VLKIMLLYYVYQHCNDFIAHEHYVSIASRLPVVQNIVTIFQVTIKCLCSRVTMQSNSVGT